MSLTLSARNTILPLILPGTVYVALHTSNPGDTASANEVSDSSYARQPATFTINTDSGLAVSNETLTFSLAASHTITHISLWSAATGGTAVESQTLTSAVSVTDGTFIIGAGNITLGGVA